MSDEQNRREDMLELTGSDIVEEDPQEQDQLARAKLRVGSTLKGKYKLDGVIGMGGMAVVYSATHRNQAEFAIKLLHTELSAHKELRSRFLREGYAANSVKHPGVVLVVDDDVSEDGAAFLVMERLRGEGVEALWARYGKLVPPQVALAIVDQLLDVLISAHEKGIVHRDLKPANLFLTTDGTVKVLDFGIARARDAMSSSFAATSAGMLMGTPAYMAPEQAMALNKDIDAQTDLWAAGATLFAMISSEFVHDAMTAPQMLVLAATRQARSIATVASDLPPVIVAAIDRSLAFDKAERYASAIEMQDGLRAAYAEAYGEELTRAPLVAAALAVSPTMPPPGAGQSGANRARVTTGSGRSAPRPSSTGPGLGASTPALGASSPAGSQATAAPVEQSTVPAAQASGGRTIVIAAAVLSAAVALLGVGWFATRPGPGPAASAAPLKAATAPPPAATVPVVAPSTIEMPAAAAPVESVVPTTAVAPAHDAAPTTSTTSTKPHGTFAHAASAQPSASAAPAKPSCDPPFYFDAQNRRVFKPECL